MKKFLFGIRFIAFILLGLIFMGGGCDESPKDKQINYETDVKPLIETTESRKVRGSCNVISAKSSCVDFVGSVFDEQKMKLSCAEGVYSKDSCPYSELGGCQAGANTVAESIIWAYEKNGGEPITAEEAVYMQMACDALPTNKWVKPMDLLKK